MLQFIVFNIPLTDNASKMAEMNSFLSHVEVKRVNPEVVDNRYWSILIGYETEDKKARSKEKTSAAAGKISYKQGQLDESENILYEKLKNWRNTKAKELDVSGYLILNNSTLATLAKVKPSHKNDLNNIAGIGEKKAGQYGDEIIMLINQKS